MMFLGPPRPPYSNPPIQPQNFQPSRFFISGVTLGLSTTVTTVVPMNYVIGQLVRLLIPQGYGCVELNEFYGYVIGIPNPNQVILNIDSSLPIFNQFIAFNGRTPPEIIAIGDVNSGGDPTTNVNNVPTTVKGAFINIS